MGIADGFWRISLIQKGDKPMEDRERIFKYFDWNDYAI